MSLKVRSQCRMARVGQLRILCIKAFHRLTHPRDLIRVGFRVSRSECRGKSTLLRTTEFARTSQPKVSLGYLKSVISTDKNAQSLQGMFLDLEARDDVTETLIAPSPDTSA